jgi:hypothetical protein
LWEQQPCLKNNAISCKIKCLFIWVLGQAYKAYLGMIDVSVASVETFGFVLKLSSIMQKKSFIRLGPEACALKTT